MKNTFKILTRTLLAGLIVLSVSCDQYSEEDALKSQQSIDFTIYVVDGTSTEKTPIEGATVTLIQSGSTREVVTDANGIAAFPDIEVGTYVYKVVAEGFVTQNRSGDATVTNFRIGQITRQVEMNSSKVEDLATIRGHIAIETDLTNTTREVAANVPVQAKVELKDGIRVFSDTTDAEGNYEIKIPTNGINGSTRVVMSYTDVEVDQKIAITKYEDEEGFFPEVLPRIETIKTVFSPSTALGDNQYFDYRAVRAVYAIADDAPADGTTAVIDKVSIDSNGEVTGISFDEGGDYTGETDGVVDITITSLNGGSGASIRINLGDQTDLEDAYNESGTATMVLTKGSGYSPDDNVSRNQSLNKIRYRRPSFNASNINVAPGGIYVINGDYGTGKSRPRAIYLDNR